VLVLCADRAPAQTDPSSFVSIQDGRFAVAGQTLSPYGSTLYPSWDRSPRVLRGAAWADPEFPRYIDFIVELAQLAGINTLRATDWLDGADDWRNDAVWTNLDYLLAKTAEQRMFVTIDLSAFRKWLIKNQSWPYDASLWDEFIRFYGGRYHDARNLLYAPVAGEIPYPGSNDPWKATADQ
jgi:hypothetical protein